MVRVSVPFLVCVAYLPGPSCAATVLASLNRLLIPDSISSLEFPFPLPSILSTFFPNTGETQRWRGTLALNDCICCFIVKYINLVPAIFLHGLHTGLDHSLYFPSWTVFFFVLEVVFMLSNHGEKNDQNNSLAAQARKEL
jgi:hypothetical protein